MKTRPLLPRALLLVSFTFVSACGRAAPPPGTATAAPRLVASATPRPSPTVKVELPSKWPISLTGPWLVYLSDQGLMAANPDGSGQTLLVEADRLGPASFYDFDVLAPPAGPRLAVYTFDDPEQQAGPSLEII
ncbi:MAG TPA: hypothetical protein VK449_05545, partial [Anaerolineales bacterium]|nr:hypothetical protein [Anaerolineales bacterium]